MTNEEWIITSEKELKEIFNQIDKNTLTNSKKVLDAFHEYSFSESDLQETVGYGYNDQGRDKLDNISNKITSISITILITILGSLNKFSNELLKSPVTQSPPNSLSQ